MVVGYNHNIKYKGEIFHVQTEDSGISCPHIITLLYRGGNIIASKKTSYADIVKMGNLNQIVEDLMKEQHKEMLRRLKSAEFDAKLGLEGVPDAAVSAPSVPQSLPPAAPPESLPLSEEKKAETGTVSSAVGEAPPKKQQSLDDLIFDFLSAGDDT